MPRPSSTIVVLVGSDAPRIIGGLDLFPNVSAHALDDAPSARDFVARAHTPYVVHDLDPLGQVGASWAGFFDGSAPYGTLEVAVESALAAFRRDEALLPDYYVVLEPEALPTTVKHWWLGALASVAPSRVLPARVSVASVRDTLAQLPSGRWWPDPPESWLHGLGRLTPDQVGLPGAAEAQGL
jgi:hypothetical protein